MIAPQMPPAEPAALRLRDKSNANADWSDAGPRLAPQAWPAFTPRFVVPASGTVFTIGSCFARNIEEHVARLGFNVPTLAFAAPEAERVAGRGNAVLNKYTPAAIRQEFEWTRRVLEAGGTVTADDVASLAYTCNDGSQIDLQLGGFRPVTPERLLARRQELFDVFRHAFTADCVVLTLGLVEAWVDETSGLAIQQAPVQAAFRRALSRFTFRRLDFATCLADVQAAIDAVRALNPAATFLITTSPVPLDRTFTDEDVITATMYGKSVLRAVCGEIVAANEGVDYFPSYESVMLTRDWSVFQSDRRHVSDAFVGKIVQRLVDTYFREAPAERRAAHAAYMASLAGEATDAGALRALSDAAPQDVRAFVHYLNALTTRPDELTLAVARYLKGGPKPEHVARVARTAKRDIEDPAAVIGAIARGAAEAGGDIAAAPTLADVWRLWIQALLREDRIPEATVAIADASRRWPDDEGFAEFATMAKRRARRAGLRDAPTAEVKSPVVAAPTPLDILATAFEGGDPAAIAMTLGAALDAGATAEAVVEIAHQAKRAAREGIVSPRLKALAEAVAARASASGTSPDPAFFPLWRLLAQALWREDRRAEAVAAATAAAALWPDSEEAVDHLDAVERKVRKQGLTATSAEPVETTRSDDVAA
ncbi:GSCFA domain-containing protein [Pseudoxanthobacter sp. M-2]